MESGMYFAVFVLGISAVHLVWKAVAFLNRISNAQNVKRSDERKRPAKRADWYMFFHLSDLTGKKEGREPKTIVSDRTVSPRKTRKQRRSGTRLYLS